MSIAELPPKPNNMKSRPYSSTRGGFTLIELMVVIGIIALLASLLSPAVQRTMARAKSTVCANNLRQIGVAVELACQDNNNQYPTIEPYPTNPVYAPPENFNNPKPMLATLSPYGVTAQVLRCPIDAQGAKYIEQEGSSYMWNPTADDEPVSNPQVYWRTNPMPIRSSRLKLATDFEAVHYGRMNRLYADGHVVAAYK
jgi:prepilin-type N-terminal cleavage/methylation domain-containing protein/prepilin-type processing-associated H-X9-DG protein